MPSQGRPGYPWAHPLAAPTNEHGTPIRFGPITPIGDGRRMLTAQRRGGKAPARERSWQDMRNRFHNRVPTGR